MEKIKILMNGPGYGHNIRMWIDYFDNYYENYSLTFISEGDFQLTGFENVRILKCITNFDYIKLIFNKIMYDKYDIFFLQAAYNQKSALLYLVFMRYKKSCLIIWGYGVVIKAFQTKNIIEKAIIHLIFRKLDIICANYPLKSYLAERIPKIRNKIKAYYWGLSREFIDETQTKVNHFTEEFLNQFSSEDILIFWPRSILRVSRFDLVIEALWLIKQVRPEALKFVKLIIWHGNETDNKYKNALIESINKYKLEHIVRFVDHPFLSYNDIKEIWKRCSFSFSILDTDGFSTQVGEAFFMKKPILLSNIPAYSFIEKKFVLSLDFVDNNPYDIKEKLLLFLNTYKEYDNDILEKRKEFCLKYQNFDLSLKDLIHSILNNTHTIFDEV